MNTKVIEQKTCDLLRRMHQNEKKMFSFSKTGLVISFIKAESCWKWPRLVMKLKGNFEVGVKSFSCQELLDSDWIIAIFNAVLFGGF